MKVPTTATLTKPLLPGLPSGRSRGHSPTSKQARSRVWPNSTCRRGGPSMTTAGEDTTPAAGEDRTPAAGEDRTPAAGKDRACLLPGRTCLLPRRSECACQREGQLVCACRRGGLNIPAAGEDNAGQCVPAAKEGS